MIRRNWQIPPGMFRALARHRVPMATSWHPNGRWLQIEDADAGSVQLHVVQVGEGPDLVLLHGYVQSSWCWRKNIAALARHFRVHAVCALGAGWSDKPLAADYGLAGRAARTTTLMDALDVGRGHLVGNSLGGALALRIAAESPERIDRLVLVNPAVAGRYPMAFLARVMHSRFAPLFRLPGADAGFWLGLRVAAYHGVDVDAEYMRYFLGPLSQPGAVDAALAIAKAYNADLGTNAALVNQVRAPVLTLVGRRDRIVPVHVTRRFGERLNPDGVRIYDGSAHCPHEEEPGRFNAEIAAFLRQT